MSSLLFDQFQRPLVSDAARDEALPQVGVNLPNSVADVHVQPPADWETALRAISPKTDHHSWLFFYWYRAKERWVLYDGVPRSLILPDQQLGVGFTGRDFFRAVDGAPPRDLPKGQSTPFVSDAQHEMARVYGVYARPFWVLEGERGGHQYAYSPDQKEFLIQCGRSDRPPEIGSAPACPFDGRVIDQLQRLNRLYALNGNIDRLRASGSSEAAEIQRAINDREIRDVSLKMLEQQLGETVEMVRTLGGRKDAEGMTINAAGQAALAAEALAAYVETGDFIM